MSQSFIFTVLPSKQAWGQTTAQLGQTALDEPWYIFPGRKSRLRNSSFTRFLSKSMGETSLSSELDGDEDRLDEGEAKREEETEEDPSVS